MDNNKIVKVQVTNHPDEVNTLLEKNWRIIKILSTKKKYGDSEVIEPCFVLGLSKE